ncbi:hypothetical protein BH11PLA2_BH11PLA2_01910 [soil metagenome]
MFVRILATALLALTASTSDAGTGYEITSKQGDKEVTYEVKFGGGKRFEQWTAFDPASKKFVYLRWPRGDAEPKPAATIWDHRTGETVKLYKFPSVESSLPVIPSVDEMKVCPMTGDKKFKAVPLLAYD